MSHVIEPAASGRAACRGCGHKIAKDELRLGERLPNPYADDSEMTLWFHPSCGAYKRPEAFLEAAEASGARLEGKDRLMKEAERGRAHRRLPRADGAERAPTGRATCRSCREKIPKGSWRIRLVFFEEGRFEPSGFIHLGCARDYLGTADVLARLLHFSPALGEPERDSLAEALSGGSSEP